MNRRVVLATIWILSTGFGVAQAAQQTLKPELVGVWASGEGASGRPRTMTITANGGFVAEFKGDPAPEVEGRVTVADSNLLIVDERGPERCVAAGAGRYAFTLNGDQLTLTAVSDGKCPGRSRFFSRTWTKQPR